MHTQNSCSPHGYLFWHRLCMFICAICCLSVLTACQPVIAPTPPLPENISIGVMPVKQAETTTELLAGNLPVVRGKASLKELQAFDNMFMDTLRTQSARSYTFISTPIPTKIQNDHRPALQKLIEQGKAANVELLIVPIILSWTERQGGGAGVVSPAELTIDIFLINVPEETLLKRAHFSERQESLASNLLNAPNFFKRGGKWVTTLELAKEATQLSMQDFGL